MVDVCCDMKRVMNSSSPSVCVSVLTGLGMPSTLDGKTVSQNLGKNEAGCTHSIGSQDMKGGIDEPPSLLARALFVLLGDFIGVVEDDEGIIRFPSLETDDRDELDGNIHDFSAVVICVYSLGVEANWKPLSGSCSILRDFLSNLTTALTLKFASDKAFCSIFPTT